MTVEAGNNDQKEKGQGGTGGAGGSGNAPAGGTSGGANGNGSGGNDETGAKLSKLEKDFADFRKTSNEENKRHREEAEKARKDADELKGSLAKALGIDPAKGNGGTSGGDPKDVLKASEAKNRRILLRASFTAAASKAGVVDADDAFALAERTLGDVNVDLTNETVDRTALEAKVAELKAAKPFLFTTPTGGGNADPTKPPGKMPDGSGRPNGETGSAYERWMKLVKQGESDPVAKRESVKFHAQNKAAINASWPRQ